MTSKNEAVRALDEIAEKVGSYTELAERLGVHRTTLYYWQRIGGVPLNKVDGFCEKINVTPGQVRPDLAEEFKALAKKFSK